MTAGTIRQRVLLLGLITIAVLGGAWLAYSTFRPSFPVVPRPAGAVPAPATALVYQELRGDRTLLWEAQAPAFDQSRLIATILHRRGYGGQFALSPDGASVAYTLLPADAADQGPDAELWAVGRDGKDQQRLTEDMDLRAPPIWSPDSRWVLYRRSFSQEMATTVELWQVDHSDPTNQRLLLREDRFLGLYPFAWSPDGTRMYYASIGAKGTDLWALDTATSAAELLAHLSDGVARNLALSPDGSKVLFQAPLRARAPTNYRIAQVDLTSGQVQTILTSANDHLSPIWTADGVGVTHSHETPSGHGLSTISQLGLPGALTSVLADSPPEGFDVPVAWSLDGRYLALRFFLGQNSRSVTGERLVVLDSHTSARVVIGGEGPVSFVGWTSAP